MVSFDEAFSNKKENHDKHLTNSIILIYWTTEFYFLKKYSI